MGLEDVGVVFISKGFQNFITNLGKATRSITDFGNMTKNKIEALRILNDTAVILSNDLKKIQTSADRVAISQQRTAQSANYLRIAQEKVRISANNAANANSKWQKSINDASAAASRASVSLKRLELIEQLNNALMAGTLSLEQYSQAALATNNQLRMLGDNASNASMSLGDMVQQVGGQLGRLGGIFGSMSSGANIGAGIGAALGSVVPVLGNGIGAIAGYLMGALGGLSAGILKWFIGLAASIGRSIINLGKQIIGWIGNVFKSILSTIKGFLGTIFNMLTGGIFQSGWNNLGNTIISSMFKFEILKEVIRKVVTTINDYSKSALEAAENLQMYTARLDFLIASQVRFADETINAADAMKIASAETQELLKWEQKLALTSPVGIDEVNKTVSMAIAMGWNVKAAKELTTSILNYSSATGLGAETSERIIYNFAQMKQQGKVTGTELRDLGRGAFMPINKILEIMYNDLKNATDEQKKFNGTFEQFREEAAAGKVDVEGFFTAFNEYIAKYMPDAMEKMNYTIYAVKDNIKDLFKTLLGWNIVGPIVKQFTAPLKELVDMLSTDQVMLGAQRIGIGVSKLVEGMKAGIGAIIQAFKTLFAASGVALPTVRNIVMTLVKLGMAFKAIGEAIAGFIEKLLMPIASRIKMRYGSTFNSMRKDFFTWGANLIVSFAKGMVQAAAKVLTAVMRAITKLLASWLMGHSPPKVAPDIDKWGAKTIDEYYGGFTDPSQAAVEAAKESVKDTTKDITDAGKAAAQSISIPNLDFGGIAGMLHTFSQADFDVLDSLQSSLKDVLSTLVTLGQITDKQSGEMFTNLSVDLINAFAEFNKTGKFSTAIFEQLRNLGGAFGSELANLLDLQIKLAVAIEETAMAQKAYDAAVKASIKSEIKVNKLIRSYNDMLRKGAKRSILKDQLKIVNAAEYEYSANKKAEMMRKSELDLAEEKQKVLEESVKLQETLIKQMTELVQAQKDAAGGAGDLAKEIEEAFGNIDLGFEPTAPWTDEELNSWISQAQTEFNDFITNDLPKMWDDAWSKSFGAGSDFRSALDEFKTQFSGVISELKIAWDAFANSVGLPPMEKILGIWDQKLTKKVTSYGPLYNPTIPAEAVLNPATGNYEVTEYTNTFTQKFLDTLTAFKDSIKEHGGIKKVLEDIARYILNKIGDGLSSLAKDPAITSSFSNAINSVMDFIGNILVPKEPTFGTNVAFAFGVDLTKKEAPLHKITQGLTELLSNAIKDTVTALETNGTLKTLGSQIATGLWEGIKTTLFPENWLRDLVLASSPGLQWMMEQGVEDQKNYQPPAPNKPLIDINKWFPDWFIKLMGGQVPEVPSINYKDSLDETGQSIAGGINTSATEQMALEDFTTLKDNTIKQLNVAYGVGSPAKNLYPVGNSLADGIAQGIKEQINIITWSLYLNPLIDKVKTFFGIVGNGPSMTFKVIGQSMVQGIIDGFKSMIPVLIAEWNALVKLLPAQIQDKWEMKSPSKLFRRIGENAIEGLSLGLRDASGLIDQFTVGSLNKGIPRLPLNATMQALPVSAGTTVNFGDTYITNDMSWAVFKSRVQRAITER